MVLWRAQKGGFTLTLINHSLLLSKWLHLNTKSEFPVSQHSESNTIIPALENSMTSWHITLSWNTTPLMKHYVQSSARQFVSKAPSYTLLWAYTQSCLLMYTLYTECLPQKKFSSVPGPSLSLPFVAFHFPSSMHITKHRDESFITLELIHDQYCWRVHKKSVTHKAFLKPLCTEVPPKTCKVLR